MTVICKLQKVSKPGSKSGGRFHAGAGSVFDTEQMSEFAISKQQESFDSLFQRNKDYAFQTAKSRVGCSAEAEDIVQVAFLQVIRLANRFQGNGSFRAWLKAIIYNICGNRLNVIRRRTARERQSVAIKQQYDSESFSSNEMQEWVEVLEKEISQLSEDDQYLLNLRFQEDFSWEQTAERMGIKKGRARIQLDRICRNLRNRMSNLQ